MSMDSILQRRPHVRLKGISEFERTLRLFDGLAFNGAGIDHGRSHIAVPEKLLDGSDIIIGLAQVTGKAVAKGMGGDALDNSRSPYRPADRLLHTALGTFYNVPNYYQLYFNISLTILSGLNTMYYIEIHWR